MAGFQRRSNDEAQPIDEVNSPSEQRDSGVDAYRDPLLGQPPLAPFSPLSADPFPPVPLAPSRSPVSLRGRTLGLGAVRSALSASPNMIGDTTGGGCGELRFDGSLSVASVGHPTFACSRVNISENNSALVRDRVYFAYRHFAQTSGISVFENSPNGGSALLDINRFTVGFESRLGNLASVELRIPVNTQMSSDLFFSQQTGPAPGEPPLVSLPVDDYETSLGNLALILKCSLYETQRCALSGGLAVNFPTSPEVRLRGLIDDDRFVIEDSMGQPIGQTDVEFSFDAVIENQLWTLSPFSAFLVSVNPNWFAQGFAQIDFPVSPLYGSIQGQLKAPFLLPAFRDQGDIDIQKLARFSLGVGRHLYQGGHSHYLSRVTATSELHYTTTIEDASLAQVEILPGIGVVPPTTVQVGNLSNRSDVLNLVLGAHAVIAKTTLTAGLANPLREGDDKGFDYELTFIANRRF